MFPSILFLSVFVFILTLTCVGTIHSLRWRCWDSMVWTLAGGLGFSYLCMHAGLAFLASTLL